MRFGRKKEGNVEEIPQDSFIPNEGSPTTAGYEADILSGRLDMLDSSVTAIRGWVEDSRSRTTELENTTSESIPPLKDDLKELKAGVDTMNGKVKQLMSLYEVISTQYNPFIETSAIPGTTSVEGTSEEEREIEELLKSIAPETFEVAKTPSVVSSGGDMVIPESFEELEEFPEYAGMQPIPEEEFGLEGYGKETMLDRMPENYSSRAFAIKFLEFLIGKTGKKNLPDLLDYYESIEWIGKEIRDSLLEMASGISVKEGFATDWKLSPEDNLKALRFLEEIKGKPVKRSVLEEIERKIEKIKGNT